MKKHWPSGVHSNTTKWKHQGSYNIMGHKGDVYTAGLQGSYDGVSIQIGPEEHQYWSSSCIYREDPATDSIEYNIAYVVASKLCLLRSRKEEKDFGVEWNKRMDELGDRRATIQELLDI